MCKSDVGGQCDFELAQLDFEIVLLQSRKCAMRSCCSSVLRPSQPSRFGRDFGNTCHAPHSAPLRIQIIQNQIREPHSESESESKCKNKSALQCPPCANDKHPARRAARWPCPPCCPQPALGPLAAMPLADRMRHVACTCTPQAPNRPPSQARTEPAPDPLHHAACIYLLLRHHHWSRTSSGRQ